MELVGEIVLFSIVESSIGSTPAESTTSTLYRRPFRFVLTGNLIPECVELGDTVSGIHTVPCGNIAEILVGVRRHLCLHASSGQPAGDECCNNKSCYHIMS